MTKAINRVMNAQMDLVGSYPRGDRQEYGIYSDMLQVLAKRLKAHIKNHYQNVIVITGGTGSGKSTLAIQLARAIDPNWSISENYIYTPSDLAAKINHRHTSSPISLYDEGSVIFNSLNFNRKEDKSLVTLFETMRSLGWTSIICLPNIKNLNASIKETHLTYHLICPDSPLVQGYDRRGFFELYYPRRYQWTSKVYHVCCGAGVFSKLPKALDDEYQEIKLAKQMALLDKFVTENLKKEQDPEEDEIE